MKTCYQRGYTNKQRGMGATIILFTIALIILVGAALAYANRGGSGSVNVQGARVYSAVLLKQSADYRDAYSRFIFDGSVTPSAMTFNVQPLASTDLFSPTNQYGVYQAPPPQSLLPAATAAWLYNPNVLVKGVGTDAGQDSITYVTQLNLETCKQINNQMYGTVAIPTATVASSTLATAGTAIDTSPTVGRSTGCMVTTDGIYVFYSTLAES